MLQMLTFSLTSFIISFLLLFISLTISKKKKNKEKNSPFECGFDPMNSCRVPFSLPFFIIAIIFLIFDIEIAFILPMIINISCTNKMTWLISMIIFMTILIFGLLFEWMQNSLEWKI